jgi:hypothetical protein
VRQVARVSPQQIETDGGQQLGFKRHRNPIRR